MEKTRILRKAFYCAQSKKESIEEQNATARAQKCIPKAVLALLLLLGGCVGSAPEITDITHALVFRSDAGRGESFEALSLYILVADADGVYDLDEMYVLHDDQALFWKLTSDTWDVDERDDGTWIGSHSLHFAQSRTLPRGTYRVQLYDRGGEIAIREFGVFENESVDDARFPFPAIEYVEGVLNLTSEYNDNVVRWYYEDDVYDYATLGGAIAVPDINADLADALEGNAVAVARSSSLFVYSYPDGRDGGYYLLTGPLMLP